MVFQNLHFDRREYYDKYMAAIVDATMKYCSSLEVPALSLAAVSNDDEKTEYVGKVVSPESMGIKLKKDIFGPIMGVAEQVPYTGKKKKTIYNLEDLYPGNDFTEKDGEYIVSGIQSFADKLASLAYVYNIPFLFCCAVANTKEDTLYQGASINPLARGILLTDDLFLKVIRSSTGYDPYSSLSMNID